MLSNITFLMIVFAVFDPFPLTLGWGYRAARDGKFEMNKSVL